MCINKYLLLVGLTFFYLKCVGQCVESRFSMLEGKWKMETKNNFEEWARSDSGLMIGKSYKIISKKKVVLEELELSCLDNLVTYTARVFDQNEGEAVSFVLNRSLKNCLSFENFKHDFPKRIVYREISKDTIFVEVLGENDRGFSYNLIRQ